MELTAAERDYFDRIRDYIQNLFGISIPILPLDHDRFLPVESGSQVLGCCHKCTDPNGNLIGYIITIDIPYIKACFYGRQAPYSPYSDDQLIETICHEIAHTQVWEHTADHENLTRQLYRMVRDSLKKTL